MSNEYESFKEMCPYEGNDFDEAIKRLKNNSYLLEHFADVIMQESIYTDSEWVKDAKTRLINALSNVSCYEDFQKKITIDIFLDYIESHSISSFSWSGMENLDSDTPYLYISTHRDIILDTALLDLALNRCGNKMCEMLIGNNLLYNSFIHDLFSINGAVIVNRNTSDMKEYRKSILMLSEYSRYCICTKKKSIWVAQKSGRSKDGIDNTSAAILKMLSHTYKTQGIPFQEFLKNIKIVPVAVSYQYDPCDFSKAKEETRRVVEGDKYKKKPNADMLDMVRGLRGYKGNVHIGIGTPVPCSITEISDAVTEIDNQIHSLYNLYDTNWFAWDYINNTDTHSDLYKNLDKKAFLKRFENADKNVFDFALKEYSNPVDSFLSVTGVV